ncbi:acyltransferase family protein [Phenylobacterium sp.]|uniref:acyltransferase family protein n=1 Tax=Phenylobacterium sp. TaxID=1871053 RepID=UPI002F93E2EE
MTAPSSASWAAAVLARRAHLGGGAERAPGAMRSGSARLDRPEGGRRYDLDWIRIIAFALLILFHVGLVYGPLDWHVQSTHTFPWMEEALLATGPWRLTLLFLVSGAALRFVAAGRSAGELALERLRRLAPPLIFGVLVLVPVQSWIEAMDKGSWTGGLIPWAAREFSPAGLADGVPVNHLWFVVYVAVYAVLASPLLTASASIRRLGDHLARHLHGWRALVVPAAYLIAIRITLFPLFGVTNNLTGDWYNHAQSFAAFLFGYLMVGHASLWKDLEGLRRTSLALACVAFPIVVIQHAHPGGGAWLGVPRAIVFGLFQWTAIAAALGYAGRYLRRASGPRLAYLNQAVFPCYLAHQTILVVAVWLVRPAKLPALAEALLLIIATFGGSLLTYEAVRRLPVVRTLWGLKAPSADDSERTRFARRRLLLGFGVAAPVVALASVTVSMAAYPDYNHARQFLSELGGAGSPAPIFFNGGVLAAGLMAALAGSGFGFALAGITGARVSAALTALAFAIAGAGLVTAALYPWPDPRHVAVNLGLGIQLAPLLLLWGLRHQRDLPRLKLFLGIVFILMATLTVITKHLVFPGTVNDANVGWWERAYAVVLVGWVAVAAIVLERRLQVQAEHARDA